MRSKTYLYIMTVKYGKERIAELEIGDSIFPHDPEVIIKQTGIKGVLLVSTVLEFSKLINVLLEYPPTTLERVVPIIKCVSCNDINEIIHAIKARRLKFKAIVFGRKGCLSREGYKLLKEELMQSTNRNSELTLIIEPLAHKVCFGVVKNREDKKFKDVRDNIIYKHE